MGIEGRILRGTLSLLILRAVQAGPRHGYAIAEWIDDVTDGEVLVEEGTLYPALHRMARDGLLEAEWGLSEARRRAKYYRLTPAGRRTLETERDEWQRYSRAMAKALAAGE